MRVNHPVVASALRLALLLLAALVAGCASYGPRVFVPEARYLRGGDAVAECARFISGLDRAVWSAGVADVQEARIAGFPYARIDRFLAASWRPAPEAVEFEAWAHRLLQLDRTARGHEIANLPAALRARLSDGVDAPRAVSARVTECGERLLQGDLADPEVRAALHAAATVPDAYRSLYRVVGVYPLTSIAFYNGVKRIQSEIYQDFEVPLESLPVAGRLMRFIPPSRPQLERAEVARILRESSRNLLGAPDPSAEDRARLFARFAPIFEIDVAQDDDLIGRPRWDVGPIAQVDTASPVVYTRLSHARFESRTLAQLNYVIWFPSRPASRPFDILAGHIDGITWRITLDTDGTPLVYDSMHNCGCYHLFLPTEKLRFDGNGRSGFEEPLLIPQQLSAAGGRLIVRIAHRTHYVQRAYFEEAAGDGVRYAFAEDETLRSLPLRGGGQRSLFGVNALVAGSERPERWFFWPMGVPSAGAMRQWGHHATAFVGRRHFDEPGLLPRYFSRAAP
jgi:hypothetical protein